MKWKAKAKNIDEIKTVITDSLIDISLPYFVYKTRTAKAPNPMISRIHAIVHNPIDGGTN